MSPPIKSRLKSLSPSWQNRLRRLNRLRWLEKSRIVRRYGASLRRDPLGVGGYVLLDPELGDFSYELENEDELAGFLASALGSDRATVAGYLAEAHEAPSLTTELEARVRLRPDIKRPVQLSMRISWYAVARLLKPRLIVETGIYHGLGSLALLTALERNRAEGSDGRLISFDLDPGTGWMVPEQLRAAWQPVYASTFDALDATLAGEAVDLFIGDTPPEYEIESFEMHGAMRHAAERIVLLCAGGDRTPALPELAGELGAEYHYFRERPRHPVFSGAGIGLVALTGQRAGVER
ncbi:MAG TPA: class I SAM-dependent methyltransferase [Solirubrobacteraceae bacterium]|jgi:hypothetical protein